MVSVIAFILLIMRLISVGFICLVLYRQIRLFKLNIDTGLVHFRIVMFILGVVFLCGNLLPIVVDFDYSFIHHTHNLNILVFYAISNATTSLAASIVLWYIYKIAGTALDEEQAKQDRKE